MRILCVILLLSCGKSGPKNYGVAGVQASFDLDTDLTQAGFFWDLPWPSDMRLRADGKPELASFPNPRGMPLIDTMRQLAMERGGFPVVPVAYFHFPAKLAALPDDLGKALLLVDVETPALLPVVATQPPADDFVPSNLLAVAPRQGFVLVPRRKYAFVVLRGLRDSTGALLGVPAGIDQVRQGVKPDASLGAAALQNYAPLWPALKTLGVADTDVAAATVFTTGDAVAETASLSDGLKAKYSITIDGLTLDSTPNDRICVLHGTVSYPQFQKGTPPFNETGSGSFEFGSDGLPVKQRDETAPVTIAVPKQAMPDAGFPLAIYFHGSGGLSTAVVDMGPTVTVGGNPTPGKGPGYVMALRGIASAGSALPVNPERLPGAGETAYLNMQNLPAMRDTFRQGIVEQRLYLEALRTLTLQPDALASCYAYAAPVKFDPDKLVAQGQSMGGMYTNLVSAVEPRIKASVPTGAGGFWTYFITVSNYVPGGAELVAILLNAAKPISFMHPAMQLVEMAWEPADPFVSMPRLGRRPLPGHPIRPIYEPVGRNDQYFPTVLYDAVALSYGHREAGSIVWPTMQDALKLGALDGILQYPVSQDLHSANGASYTGVVVQYEGDGIEDPHAIYRQLGAVKYQYSCFLDSFLKTGTASVPAPAAEDAACP